MIDFRNIQNFQKMLAFNKIQTMQKLKMFQSNPNLINSNNITGSFGSNNMRPNNSSGVSTQNHCNSVNGQTNVRVVDPNIPNKFSVRKPSRNSSDHAKLISITGK